MKCLLGPLTLTIAALLFASVAIAAESDNESKTIDRKIDISDADWDPNYRAAYRITKKMKLCKLDNPYMCGLYGRRRIMEPSVKGRIKNTKCRGFFCTPSNTSSTQLDL